MMKMTTAKLLFLYSLALYSTAVTAGPAASGKAPPPSTNRFLVQALDATDADLNALLKPAGAIMSGGSRKAGSMGFRTMTLNRNMEVEKIRELFLRRGLYVEEDVVLEASLVPNDSDYPRLWSMPKIGAPQAWDTFQGNGSLTVCVIDTGIDYTHPDLKANILHKGYNAITGAFDAMDDNGHGTHCAGTIAGAGNNGIGVTGVAWNVKLVGCKFMNSRGSGYTSDALECIAYCRNQKARISSNSWGGRGYSSAMFAEISANRAAGQLFVAAAGNANINVDTSPIYPASYNHDNVVSVGASTTTDAKSSYSNFGLASVDLSAPGDSIYSTYPGNRYSVLSGTSMAAPHVAGAAALLWQYAPHLTYDEVKGLLMANVDKTSGLASASVTGGRLQLGRAMDKLKSVVPPSPSPDTGCLGRH
jgi:subtilisin family serine protease